MGTFGPGWCNVRLLGWPELVVRTHSTVVASAAACIMGRASCRHTYSGGGSARSKGLGQLHW